MAKEISLYLMALLYFAAGVNHFINPKIYVKIIPRWLPQPELINYISGASEIVLALLLIPVLTRITAAWLLIALLVVIFPANIQMLINYQRAKHPMLWLAWLRLPLQIILIWWAWLYTQ